MTEYTVCFRDNNTVVINDHYALADVARFGLYYRFLCAFHAFLGFF